ncbi:hypothetical protein AB205_0131780, partial [Aquarana catesbeiana]
MSPTRHNLNVMEVVNQTSSDRFILIGLSNVPHLQVIFFLVFLLMYIITLSGNLLLIIVVRINPKLQTPMYFFLGNLSIVDIFFSTTIVPKLLINTLSIDKSISLLGNLCPLCVLCDVHNNVVRKLSTKYYGEDGEDQPKATNPYGFFPKQPLHCRHYFLIHYCSQNCHKHSIYLGLGGTECINLLVMAYDRFAAMIRPMHYNFIMNQMLCAGFIAGAWKILYLRVSLSFQKNNERNVMEEVNQTSTGNFILLGLSNVPSLQEIYALVFSVMYIITLSGNFLLIIVVRINPKLQTPMYFFLSNLSIIDIGFSSTIVPLIIINTLIKDRSISLLECAVQMFFHLGLGVTECVILGVMAYDRFAAICRPLHYITIMNKMLCVGLAAGSWSISFLNSTIHVVLIFQLPYCKSHHVNHFFCE